MIRRITGLAALAWLALASCDAPQPPAPAAPPKPVAPVPPAPTSVEPVAPDPNAPPPAKALEIDKKYSNMIPVQPGETMISGNDRFWITFLNQTRKPVGGKVTGVFRFTYFQPGPVHDNGATVLWGDNLMTADCATGQLWMGEIKAYGLDAALLSTESQPGEGRLLPTGPGTKDYLASLCPAS